MSIDSLNNRISKKGKNRDELSSKEPNQPESKGKKQDVPGTVKGISDAFKKLGINAEDEQGDE